MHPDRSKLFVSVVISTGIAILLVAGLFQYWQFQVEPFFKIVQTLTTEGQNATREVLAYPSQYHVFGILAGILYAVGISVLVTTIVERNLSRYQARVEEARLSTLRDDLHRDVFETLFSKLVPAPVFETIRSAVIRSGLVRRNARLDIEIHEGGSGFEVEMRTFVELHNTSNDALTELGEIELFSGVGSKVSLDRACCSRGDIKSIDYDCANPDSATGVEIVTRDGTDFVKFEIDIPGHDHVDVLTVIRSTFASEIQDAFFFKTATIDITIAVSHPKGYKFDIYPSFSRPLRKVMEDGTRSTYRVDGAILPRQGFVYCLTKIADPGA